MALSADILPFHAFLSLLSASPPLTFESLPPSASAVQWDAESGLETQGVASW